jgi:primary-amine oxidase
VTDTFTTSATVSAALASLTVDEITAARAVLVREGLLGDDTHVSYFGLAEQDKRELLADGAVPAARRFRAMLVDMRSGDSHDVIVSPAEDRVVSARALDPAVDGQVPVVLLEFGLVEEVVHKDERWLEAMRKRGLPISASFE